LTQTSRHKWVTFTYKGEETLYITNAFKHTDLKIAFRTNNTIKNLLRHRNPMPDKFSSSGVYKLTCPDCHKVYAGQTRRRFYTLYDEHKSAFYHNSAPQILHNTSTIRHIPLAPLTASCKCYITKRKEHI
jgi:hypothetical protein